MTTQDNDKTLRALLDDYRRPAPPQLLDDVRAEMARRGLDVAPAARPKRSHKLLIPLFIGAAAASVAIVIALHMPQQPAAVTLPTSPQVTASAATPPSSPTAIPQQSAAIATTRQPLAAIKGATALPQATTATVLPAADDHNTNNSALPTTPSAEVRGELPQATTPPATHATTPAAPNHTPQPRLTRRQRGTVLLALNAAGAGGNSYNGSPFSASQLMMTSVAADPLMYYAATNTIATRDIPTPERHVSHAIPVRMGLQVAYQTPSGWTLSTGISYSRWATTITERQQWVSTRTAQRLHFVGIPIEVGHDVVSRGPVRAYVSAGVEAMKLVKGKSSSQSTIAGEQGDSYSCDVKMSRLQWSLGGNVGVEYRVAGPVGVYIEPGARYYPNNGSQLETAYTEHPWSFEVKAGARISLGK